MSNPALQQLDADRKRMQADTDRVLAAKTQREAQTLQQFSQEAAAMNAQNTAPHGPEQLLTGEWKQKLEAAHPSEREALARQFAETEWSAGACNKAAFSSRENYILGRSAELVGRFKAYGASPGIQTFEAPKR